MFVSRDDCYQDRGRGTGKGREQMLAVATLARFPGIRSAPAHTAFTDEAALLSRAGPLPPSLTVYLLFFFNPD